MFNRVSDGLARFRWAFLLALIVAEVTLVSLRFDARTARAGHFLSPLIANAGTIARVGIAVGLGAVIGGWSCRHTILRQRAAGPGDWRRMVPALAGNLLAFGSFYGLSALVLETASARDFDQALITAWVLSGTLVLIFWAMACLPVVVWLSLFRSGGLGLAVGPALGAIAYVVGLLSRHQWQKLSRATFQLVRAMLGLVFRGTICEPDRMLVGTTTFQVTIAPECSGYEGMGMIATLLGLSLWLLRRDFRFPRALIVLPVGIILIWLANAFRITALVAIGTWGYPELAIGGFHSLAGWVLFVMIGLCLIALARSPRFGLAVCEGAIAGELNRGRHDGAYLVPAMAIIATAMVTTSLAPGFDRYYPARVIVASVAIWFYRKSYSELRPAWSWESIAIGVGVFALWMALEPMANPSASGPPAPSAGNDPLASAWMTAWLLFRVFGSVVTVPLAEELAFRGYVTRRLMSADFQAVEPGRMSWWSLLVSSLLFGILHGRWFAGTLAGAAYALAYRRRGALADAVLAHAVTNGLIAVTVLTTGNWSLWS